MVFDELNTHQQAFLKTLAWKITRLMDLAEQGSTIAYFRLGTRRINGQEVVLKLVAEDVDNENPAKQNEINL